MELGLFVDHDCNLRCSYCYTGQKRRQPMSLVTAERAIDFALNRDPCGLELSFFGGEPLLRIDLIEHATLYAERQLAELCPSEKLHVALNTNATLVDERCEDFVRNHPAMNAFVSLDGPASVHNRYRVSSQRRGSHAATREGVLRLAAAGANVVALAVTNPDTASSLGDVAAELFSLPITRAHVSCNLRATWDATALDALRQGTLVAARLWGDQFRAGRCIQFEPFTMKILSHLHGSMPCPSRCRMEAHELIVAPSGHLYGCGELVAEDSDERFVIGDLERGLDWDQVTRLRAAKNRVFVTCEGCAQLSRCSNYCGCKQVALTGTHGGVTEAFCDIEQAFIGAADAVAEELYREGCPAFTQFFYQQSWTPNTPDGLAQLRGRKPLKAHIQ